MAPAPNTFKKAWLSDYPGSLEMEMFLGVGLTAPAPYIFFTA